MLKVQNHNKVLPHVGEHCHCIKMKMGTHELGKRNLNAPTLYHGRIAFDWLISTNLTFILWCDWNTSYSVTKSTCEVWCFKNEFTKALLEIWLKLLGQKYTCNKWNYQFFFGFGIAFPKSWLEPHREHVDCAEETSLCQEANTFSWTSSILSRGVGQISGLAGACGWLSKVPFLTQPLYMGCTLYQLI